MSKYIDPRNKVLSHIDRLDAIKNGETPAPINLEIDLSNRCSLGCEWCHFAYTHTKGPLANKVDSPTNRIPGGDLMDYEMAKLVIVEAKETGVRSITWTGGGEPTLHPRFDDIVLFAHQHGIDQGLYTHGGHINKDRAVLLKKVMKWVYVSLDECTPEAYKKSKGVDGWERAVNGIECLADGDATIGMGFLLHKNNYHQLKDMIKLQWLTDADYVQFRPTVQYEQENQASPSENTAWLDDCIKELKKVQDIPNVLADIERFEYYRHWNGRSYDTCYWTQLQSVITPDGSVWTCVNKREHSGEKIGNLNDESFWDIWQRSHAVKVDGNCRVMCRGHIANITLDSIMTNPPHRNFI